MFWVHHRIWTIDARAVAHIMSKPYEYKKPAILRRALMRYMKSGLIPAEGERHRVQRKVVQKLFSGQSLRAYAGLVQLKADQVGDMGGRHDAWGADARVMRCRLARACGTRRDKTAICYLFDQAVCNRRGELVRTIDMQY